MNGLPTRSLLPLLFLVGCGGKAVTPDAAPTAPAWAYPPAARGEVVDDFFGTAVPDPYRWMEDPDAPETRSWIEAEVALTESYLSQTRARADLQARLTELWNYERYGAPWKEGGHYFWWKNDGLQNQSVLYTADTLEAAPRVLIDPNAFSADGTISLAELTVSPDGTKVAYGLSDGGSDWRTWHVRDVGTGEDLPDTVSWVKFSDAAWAHDGSGFYYARFPQPTNPLEEVVENQRVYFHALGTEQGQDTLVYATPEAPRQGWGAAVSEKGDTLYLYGSEGTEDMNRLYYEDLTKKDPVPVKVFDAFDASYTVLHEEGTTWWILTNKDAPKRRIVKVNRDKPETLVEVLPEGEEVIDGASVVGGHLVVSTLHDAHTAVKVYDMSGKLIREVALPGLGTARGFGGKPDDPETFYSYTSYTEPGAIYRYDVETGASTLWRKPTIPADTSDLVTDQVFFPSKDGTPIPMFLTHKAGVVLDGNNPTLLYGYGGFNIPITPGFYVSNLAWLERGGVYAVVNLRGGGEYGEAWHDAGRLANKQNVFDDFIAAAEYLIAQKWTRTERLAIHGGSNGGLLVGAAMTQRPDLFAAAIPAVGVMDMLRYHLFTIGWAWASDYGRSDDPEMFPILHAYSPVHNLHAGTRYPSTLVLTGDHDDRVVPAHSFKFAAELQHDHAGSNPVLIRINTRAGHGAGKSTQMRIAEEADKWAFLIRELGMEAELYPVVVPTE